MTSRAGANLGSASRYQRCVNKTAIAGNATHHVLMGIVHPAVEFTPG